ncbi:MAG: phospholipase D-like domain-containing protein [Bdellovibrionia bacterium]
MFLLSIGLCWADPTLFLPNPADSANVRLNLAQNAKGEVLASTFVAQADQAGLTYLAQLREAARQGKRTVYVVDALGLHIPRTLLSYLASEGVEIYLYHPFDWRNPGSYLKRLHSKLFVVDGEHLVMGDRNDGDEYAGLSKTSYLGRDAYVRGEAASDAKAHIEELIRSSEVTRFKPLQLSEIERATVKTKLDRAYTRPLARRLRKSEAWKSSVIASDSVEFYHDPIGKKGIAPGVDQKIIEAIDGAREQIIFENAYVVLSDSMKQALKRARAREVPIKVITNSAKTTNSPLVGAVWEDSKKFLASIGAEVWELSDQESEKPNGKVKERVKEKFRNIRKALKGKYEAGSGFNMLHSKTMLIDGKHSYIMSYNFDPRSENLNMETVLYVKGQGFADKLNAEIQQDFAQSKYKLVAASGKVLERGDESGIACFKRKLIKLIESQL